MDSKLLDRILKECCNEPVLDGKRITYIEVFGGVKEERTYLCRGLMKHYGGLGKVIWNHQESSFKLEVDSDFVDVYRISIDGLRNFILKLPET